MKQLKNGTEWLRNQIMLGMEGEESISKEMLVGTFEESLEGMMQTQTELLKSMLEKCIKDSGCYLIIEPGREDSELIKDLEISNTHIATETEIQAFTIPANQLPTRLVAIGTSPKTPEAIEVYLDKGWQLEIQIHAQKPILNFDIKLMGLPDFFY